MNADNRLHKQKGIQTAVFYCRRLDNASLLGNGKRDIRGVGVLLLHIPVFDAVI